MKEARGMRRKQTAQKRIGRVKRKEREGGRTRGMNGRKLKEEGRGGKMREEGRKGGERRGKNLVETVADMVGRMTNEQWEEMMEGAEKEGEEQVAREGGTEELMEAEWERMFGEDVEIEREEGGGEGEGAEGGKGAEEGTEARLEGGLRQCGQWRWRSGLRKQRRRRRTRKGRNRRMRK